MALTVLLFEDDTAQHFRPLSWSVPAYELPCGLFNLRERVGSAAAARGCKAVLLPRALLQPLQGIKVPRGWSAGPDEAAAAVSGADRVLWLSARLRGEASLLADLLDGAGRDRVLTDQDGLLAAACDPATAADLLASWRTWNDAEEISWTIPNRPVAKWTPTLPAPEGSISAWRRLWDRVPELGTALAADLAHTLEHAGGTIPGRELFGVITVAADIPVWERSSTPRPLDAPPPGVTVIGDGGVWIAEGAELDPGVVLDTRCGPIVLEREVRVRSQAVLEGPLALCAGAVAKPHAALGPEVIVGPVGRVAGEIAETQLSAFANKQHAGFLGHALIGSWTNLGADTTNSDLKNNYGLIKVNAGLGPEETGTRFLGLMMAEHAKSAIGTTFNTATTVGFSANVFASGFPRACICNFSWGDGRGRQFAVDRALETAAIVMPRRGVQCTEAHADLFRALSDGAAVRLAGRNGTKG